MIRDCSTALPDEYFHLSVSDVHVWHMSLQPPASRLSELKAFLSAQERARAEGFAFEDDRGRFIVAHGILKTIVSRYVNQEPGPCRSPLVGMGNPL